MIPSSADDTVVGDLVGIRWTAHHLDDPPPMETVGWITQTTDDFVIVAQSRDEDQTFHRAHTTVLRAYMREVHRLQQVRE